MIIMPIGRTPKAPRSQSPTSVSPGGPDAKTAKAEDRRSQLLKIAARLFADHGFEATTTRMIAKEANMLSGSLYHHFGTKEEMLHEILRHGVREMSLSSHEIAASNAGVEEKLVAMILLYLKDLFDDHYAFSILYNDRRYLRRHPDFAYVAEAKKAMFLNWCLVLQQGMDTDLFRSDIDPYMVVTTIIRMLSTSADWFLRTSEHAYDGPVPSDRDGLTEFNVQVVLRIVRASRRIDDTVPYSAAHELVSKSQNDV